MSARAAGPVSLLLPALTGSLSLPLAAMARPAEARRLAGRRTLPLRVTHRAVIAALSLTAAAIPLGAATNRPTHREVRFLAFGRLSFHSRQRGANQPAVHRPFVIGSGFVPGGVLVRLVFLDARRCGFGIGDGGRCGFYRFGGRYQRQVGLILDRW